MPGLHLKEAQEGDEDAWTHNLLESSLTQTLSMERDINSMIITLYNQGHKKETYTRKEKLCFMHLWPLKRK